MNDGLKSGSVTAVITAYNAERYITKAINSALNQTAGPVQVIVVDDASTDNTITVAESCGSPVKVIRLKENSGPAVGRTVGLMACETEFVAFLDSDDYWQPEFVEKTVGFLEQHPELVAVNTGYGKRDWDGNDYFGPVLDVGDLAFYGTEGAICPNFYQFWAKYRCVLTGTVMMRTAVARLTNGQRKELRLTQDLEFWGYLATFGAWGFIPQPLFITDQEAIKPSERLAKFKRRFMFFRDLEVDQWAARIHGRLTDPVSREAFENFLGHIATTIALANAYTFRFRKSYHLSCQWENRLDHGLGSVLRIGIQGGPLLWPLVCIAIRSREYIKAYSRIPAELNFLKRKKGT